MTEPTHGVSMIELAQMVDGFTTIGEYVVETGDVLTISPAGKLIRVAGPHVIHEDVSLPAALFGYMVKLVDADPDVVAKLMHPR